MDLEHYSPMCHALYNAELEMATRGLGMWCLYRNVLVRAKELKLSEKN